MKKEKKKEEKWMSWRISDTREDVRGWKCSGGGFRGWCGGRRGGLVLRYTFRLFVLSEHGFVKTER